MATITTGRTFNASTTISTGLKGSMAYNVLANVLGQLSDGIWENSNAMRNYWPYVRIELVDDNDVNIVIDECLYGSRGGYNKFRTMNATSIKDWFAKKAKSVVNHEAKDYPTRSLSFNKKNDEELDYMYDHFDRNGKIRVCDVYEVYNALKLK